MFGKERFRHVISAHARETAKGILQAVIDELNRFSKPLGKDDDVTLVVIKVGSLPLRVQGFIGSGFSPAAGLKSGQSNRKKN